MTASAFNETVVLETLDGYEFEKLCAKIFQKLEYGSVEVMPLSGDAGRDLLIHTREGLVVVECKHQPHTSIGRPVVQKLHSAVISSKAVKGILVTSGKFSVQAVDHANTLMPKIEMVDKKILADLATRAGIEIILEGKCHTVLRYPVSQAQVLKEKIAAFIENKARSNPARVAEILKINDRRIGFIPSYMIQYDINATFETNVGIVHREYLEDGKFLVDGNTGNLLKQELANHLSSAPLAVYNEADFSGNQISRKDFVIDDRTLAGIAKKIIIDRHTHSVSYHGRNNQRYTKLCVPAEKNVYVSNIKQVYLPFQDIHLGLIGQDYSINGIENADRMLGYTAMANCKICNSYVNSGGVVCNSCGAVVHGPRFLDSHGFTCKICGKTLCRDCTYNGGIFHKICRECADKNRRQLKPLSRSMHQRIIAGSGCLCLGGLSIITNFNTLASIVLILTGLGIFVTDYRGNAPPYEII